MIDDLDEHLPEAGSLDRAALPPAMFLAWCGNLQLVSAGFVEAHQSLLVRLRYRDLSPAEFFTAATSGSIDPVDLSPEGQAFARSYYPRYLEDLRLVFGPDIYETRDDWTNYDLIAPQITQHFMAWKGSAKRGHKQRRSNPGAGRKWWQRWRS